MCAIPLTAFVMRSDATACRRTAIALRGLGFAVAEFGDGAHLYGHAIRAASVSSHRDRRSFVILAEPTDDVLQDLAVLRSGNWPTPLVLVGRDASPEVARALRAVCLSSETPTPRELQQAIDAALEACTPN